MQPKFKKNDLVAIPKEEVVGNVLEVCGDTIVVTRPVLKASCYNEPELKAIDPTTAFLTELQALMRKYDVTFTDYEGYCVSFKIGGNSISFDTSYEVVTPDNIFDYEK